MNEYDSLLQVRYSYAGDKDAIGYVTSGSETIQEIKELIMGKNIVIGLDQATNKTGCCFMDFDTRQVLAVMDLINLGFPSKFMYFQAIYNFMSNHIADENVVHFVYEIPLEHASNSYVRRALESMRLFIKDFKKWIPSLSKTNMVEINNQTWRSLFLKDPCYKGRRKTRRDAKLAAQEEAAKRCSDMAAYLYSSEDPPDSCDAVGIAYGALEEIYSSRDPKIRRPNRTMPKTSAKVKYEVIPLAPENLDEILKSRFFAYLPDHFELLEFNPEMSVEENCKRYSCNNSSLGIIPITDSKVCSELKWETGQELESGQIYICFCWR